MKPTRIAIVGGGVGGLACALALHARGIRADIFEQAPEIQEVGVGINVLPHAVTILAELGLLAQLDRVAIRTGVLSYLNRFGQEIWSEPRGIEAGYNVPQFSIHRGRLQRVLLDAVLDRLGPVVHAGRRLVAVNQNSNSVTACFEARDGAVTLTFDALIGADGIHSATRKTFYPEEGAPSWSGVMIWRGATDWPAFADGRSMLIAGGMREKVVVYPIALGGDPSLRLTNWTVNIKIGGPDTPIPRREDWSRPGQLSDILRHLERFAIPHVDVRGLVSKTASSWEFPMCDRDPLPAWSHGRVTLLGDAAHPMYPVGSNGAGQAILDADCLSRCMQSTDDIAAAFQAYEAERLPMTAEIVRRNRIGGPESVIDAVEVRSPDGFDDLDAVISREDLKSIVHGYSQMAGFSREQLAEKLRK